jgi:signal peptidase I
VSELDAVVQPQTAADASSRPARRPWLAALLSFFAGAGHLYAGWPKRAGIIVVADIVASAAIALSMFFVRGWLSLLTLVLYTGWRLYVVVSAWKVARHQPRILDRLRGWRLAGAIAALVVVSVAVNEVQSVSIKERLGEAFWIPSNAMEPTVLAGDYIVVRRSSRDALIRGTLCVFRKSDGTGFLKRIVALPGDTIAMRGGILIRNGSPVAEPYTMRDSTLGDEHFAEMTWQRAMVVGVAGTASYRPTIDDWGPLVVPDLHVFVLGDNRTNSADSRFIGFIPDSAITHTPAWVYFSRDTALGIRWTRIGHKF